MGHRRQGRRAVAAAVALVTAAFGLVAAAPPAAADGPGVGVGWVVTMGDSYISGEAGRWAGNTDTGEQHHDALGPSAYFDNATRTAEQISGCHRSASFEGAIGSGLAALNLACSGAKTASVLDGSTWKPGIDFFADSSGHLGQARMLQDFARTHNVRLIALSIGGNDFNFASIVTQCVADWMSSPAWWPDYCSDDSSVTANFTAANVSARRAAIANAIRNVRTAMTNAGYAASQYTIVVQGYMSPIPNGTGFRYAESGWDRANLGGCEFWNRDANWANGTALPTINNAVFGAAADTGFTNVRTLNLSSAFNGRRLCESTVGRLEEVGLADWTQAGAVDRTEWINTIRTVTTWGTDYYIQESLHPNHWGQLALRSCLRLVWNGGAPRSGTCRIAGTGLSNGEPRMSLS